MPYLKYNYIYNYKCLCYVYRKNEIRIIGAGTWRKGKKLYEKKKKNRL